MINEKKVAVYARVSTEEQGDKGYSLESQIEEGIKLAEKLGYTKSEIVVYSDQASGATLDRPQLSELREQINYGEKPDIIIVYDPDRLSRTLMHQLLLTDEWLKAGIQLEFVNFEWKQTAEGMMFYQLRGIFAQYEREKIRERTIRGRLTKIKKYKKLSVDPRLYGFQFDTKIDELIENPEESEIVRYIFSLAANGLSGQEIARKLNKEKVRAPRGVNWHGATITRIIRNKSYLGIYMAYKSDYHQGFKRIRPEEEQFPLSIPRIVDDDLFKKANETIEKNRTHMGRPAKRSYLLKQLDYCQCGTAMVATVKSGNREYTYYTCSSKRKDCSIGYWNTTVVDEVVWRKIVIALSSSNQAYEQVIANFTGSKEEKASYSTRLQKLQHQEEKLLELYLHGQIEEEMFLRKKEKLSIAKRDVVDKLNSMTKRKARYVKIDKNELPNFLYNLSIEQRREILPFIVERVTFCENRKLEIELKLSDGYYWK